MEISATIVLLQLIDCIESMKNEVKKKMNMMERALLYQSHTRNNSQEQNSIGKKKFSRCAIGRRMRSIVRVSKSTTLSGFGVAHARQIANSRKSIVFSRRASIITLRIFMGA
jgi:hypothetical protein